MTYEGTWAPTGWDPGIVVAWRVRWFVLILTPAMVILVLAVLVVFVDSGLQAITDDAWNRRSEPDVMPLPDWLAGVVAVVVAPIMIWMLVREMRTKSLLETQEFPGAVKVRGASRATRSTVMTIPDGASVELELVPAGRGAYGALQLYDVRLIAGRHKADWATGVGKRAFDPRKLLATFESHGITARVSTEFDLVESEPAARS